jgi:hypothetical protein
MRHLVQQSAQRHSHHQSEHVRCARAALGETGFLASALLGHAVYPCISLCWYLLHLARTACHHSAMAAK